MFLYLQSHTVYPIVDAKSCKLWRNYDGNEPEVAWKVNIAIHYCPRLDDHFPHRPIAPWWLPHRWLESAGWLAGWLVQLIPELPLSPTPPPLVRQVMAPQSEVIPLVTNTLHMALHCRVGASHYISAISNHDSDQVESKRGLNHIISRDPFSHLWTHFGPNWLGPLSLLQLINLDRADRPSSIYW